MKCKYLQEMVICLYLYVSSAFKGKQSENPSSCSLLERMRIVRNSCIPVTRNSHAIIPFNPFSPLDIVISRAEFRSLHFSSSFRSPNRAGSSSIICTRSNAPGVAGECVVGLIQSHSLYASSTSAGFWPSASAGASFVSSSGFCWASAAFLASSSAFRFSSSAFRLASSSARFLASFSSSTFRRASSSSWRLSLKRWMTGPADALSSSSLATYCALVASSPSSYSQSYRNVSEAQYAGMCFRLTSSVSHLALIFAFSSSLANSA